MGAPRVSSPARPDQSACLDLLHRIHSVPGNASAPACRRHQDLARKSTGSTAPHPASPHYPERLAAQRRTVDHQHRASSGLGRVEPHKTTTPGAAHLAVVAIFKTASNKSRYLRQQLLNSGGLWIHGNDTNSRRGYARGIGLTRQESRLRSATSGGCARECPALPLHRFMVSPATRRA